MNTMKKLLLLLPVLLMMLVTGCLKDNPNPQTIVFPSGEAMENLEKYDTLFNYLLSEPDSLHLLYDGDNPPVLQGEYHFKQIDTVGFNFHVPNLQPDIYDSLLFRFGEKLKLMVDTIYDTIGLHGDTLFHDSDTIVLAQDSIIMQIDSNYVNPVEPGQKTIRCAIFGDIVKDDWREDSLGYILGNHDHFTVCFAIEYPLGNLTLTRGYAVTGVLAETTIAGVPVQTIEQPRVSWVNIDARPQASNKELIGRIGVYKANKVKKYEWSE